MKYRHYAMAVGYGEAPVGAVNQLCEHVNLMLRNGYRLEGGVSMAVNSGDGPRGAWSSYCAAQAVSIENDD